MMRSSTDIETLKPFEARSVIESLREGTVPQDFVPVFTVGRDKWLRFIEEDLDLYIAEGGSKVRFVNGDYGDGKTHFMSVVMHLARDKDFAASFVVLTREVPIHKFEVVYQAIVRQLRGKFEGIGIRALVEDWLNAIRSDVADAGTDKLDERLAEQTSALRELPGMDLNVANALAGVAENVLLPLGEEETQETRDQAVETLMQWLEGTRVAKRNLKPFQIFEVLNKTNSKRFLASLIAFLRHRGHKGLILFLDELETVLAQSASIRNAAYENVRLLIDNTEHAQHLHIFFSIIPDVVTVDKGFRSYDALWSRVRSIGQSKRLNYRSVLVDLHRTPLQMKELVELGRRLRRIHEIAYRWDASDLVKDAMLEEVCKKQKKMGLLSEVRLYVKQILRILDMAEQGENPEETLDLDEVAVSTQQDVEDEKMAQFQPKWDT